MSRIYKHAERKVIHKTNLSNTICSILMVYSGRYENPAKSQGSHGVSDHSPGIERLSRCGLRIAVVDWALSMVDCGLR